MTGPEHRRRAVRAARGARRAAAGFTLIEVVVALAIVVLGLAAVLGALSSSASAIMYLRDKTFAQWVALNQIATVRLTAQQQNQPPQTGDTNGDVDLAGRKWHWLQKVTPAEVPGMVRIDVSVRPTDVKGDDQHGWYTTVTGMYSDALAQARGDSPAWGQGAGPVAQAAAGAQGATFQLQDSSSSSSSSSDSSTPGDGSAPGSSSSTSSPGGLQ
jgi:general secretion pathway protein I